MKKTKISSSDTKYEASLDCGKIITLSFFESNWINFVPKIQLSLIFVFFKSKSLFFLYLKRTNPIFSLGLFATTVWSRSIRSGFEIRMHTNCYSPNQFIRFELMPYRFLLENTFAFSQVASQLSEIRSTYVSSLIKHSLYAFIQIAAQLTRLYCCIKLSCWHCHYSMLSLCGCL